MLRFSRRARAIILLFTLCILYGYRICLPGVTNHCSPGNIWAQLQSSGSIRQDEPQLDATILSSNTPIVNLVMATVVGDDISWTENISIQKLRIIQYFADDQNAPFHPQKNKGREATMFFTYFYDFYDELPDISIMIHAHEDPWHSEAVLSNSMTYTLSHLDLAEVQRRGYANLRVAWDDGCPGWINTSLTPEESHKQEEPFMKPAFLELFSPRDGDQNTPVDVPEILGVPCCSQFAVTREAIRSVPREEYARYTQWMLDTELRDYISGRVWEHLFHFLFTKKAIDCPIEWKTYCKMYHVCFKDHDQMKDYIYLGWEAQNLQAKLRFWTEIWDPHEGERARQRIKEINMIKHDMKQEALARGSDSEWMAVEINDIYQE